MKLSVPNQLSDLTVAQYQKLAEINLDSTDEKWLIEAVTIFCKLTKEEVNTMSLQDLARISQIIKKLNDVDNQNEELIRIIDYKGQRYGFHPNLSKLTVGEFADLESFCSKGLFENLGSVLSILYRPIKEEHKNFYSIEEYTGDVFPDHWEELRMNVVMGAINFFLSIGVVFTKDLANSLVEGAKEI